MAIITQNIVQTSRPVGPSLFLERTYKTRRIQKPVADLKKALPYAFHRWAATNYRRYGNSPDIDVSSTIWQTQEQFSSDVSSTLSNMSNRAKLAYNRAYGKAYESVKTGSADIMALVAERLQAYAMIRDRFTQILSVAQAVDKKSWRGLAKALGTTVSDLKRRHKRDTGFLTTPASTFLEVYWGWMPMIGDITAALTFLGKEIPEGTFSASGGYDINFTRDYKDGSSRVKQTSKGVFRVKVGGRITVQSAVQAELARLGVTNVSQSLYEIAPWSWLIDWFTSVGEMIESWDDTLHVSIVDPYVTRFSKGTDVIRYRENEGTPSERGWDLSRTRCHMTRETPTSLPRPYFTYQLPDVTWKRVAVVSSLVVLKLKRFQRLSTYYL